MKKKICIFLCSLLLFLSSSVPAYANIAQSAFFKPLSTVNANTYNVAAEHFNITKFDPGSQNSYFLLYNTVTQNTAVVCSASGRLSVYSSNDKLIFSNQGGSQCRLLTDIPSVLDSSAMWGGTLIASNMISGTLEVGPGCDYDFVLGGFTQGVNADDVYNTVNDFFQHTRQVHLVLEEQTVQGVLTEITSLLPLLMPLMVAYMSLRKGLMFVWTILRQS